MGNYRVHWEIDVEDEPTPEAAARYALDAILRPGSIAHVFDVDDGTNPPTRIDLDAADAPEQIEIRFTIRETTRYTGQAWIDPALWREQTGMPLCAETLDEDTLRDFLDSCGGEVTESCGDIGGQVWTDFEINERTL